MSGKSATVYVIDLGPTLGECRNGRIETDLDYGMRYVWDKVGTVLSESKTTQTVGFVGFRTDETVNDLDGDEYQNIAVLKPIEQMFMSDLPDLRKKIIPHDTVGGDAISAVVVAIDMIDKKTKLKSGKPGKYNRKIALITDGQGNIEDEGIELIGEKLTESEIDLVVIGIDFDDPEYGFKEEEKSPRKKKNEALLRKLTESTERGIFGTAAEVIDSLVIPHVKVSRPYSTYDGRLGLGDFDHYPETAMYIDVKRYFRIKQAKPPSASSFVTQAQGGSAQSSNTVAGDTDMPDAPTGDDLTAVTNSRTYKIADASLGLSEQTIRPEELERGYEYGRTAVYLSDEDKVVTDFNTIKSLSIIGFVPSDKYEKYLNMGESCITVAQAGNDKASMALSSLIHALFELESYAVARIVLKDNKAPQIILMAPMIDQQGDIHLEALVDVPLPFAEDIRSYKFPPLDRVITTSGKSLQEHRNLPTEDLISAMDDYVDAMDLSTHGEDGAEYMPIEDTYSPAVHRIIEAVKQRAMYPDQPIGPPADILMQWSAPPEDLVKQSEAQLERLLEVADVKKVPPKAKGKRGKAEPIKPLSGLDVNSLLTSTRKSGVISPQNAIPEFKQLLEKSSLSNLDSAVSQMSTIIENQLRESYSTGFDQALANFRVMREEVKRLEFHDKWNPWLRGFKEKLAKGELGGDRRDFWAKVRQERLGLIDEGQLSASDVTEEEGREFYLLSPALPNRKKE